MTLVYHRKSVNMLTRSMLVVAGTSISWTAASSADARCMARHEVSLSASGRKAGACKVGPASFKTRSGLCKAAMFGRWKQLLTSYGRTGPARLRPESADVSSVAWPASQEPHSYHAAKQSAGSGDYFKAWKALRQNGFYANWLHKPAELEAFCTVLEA